MKILFLFRDLYDSKYILRRLSDKGLIGTIVLEKGIKAKKRKLKKLFITNSILYYPILLLDIIALYIYSEITLKAMIMRMGKYTYPSDKIKLIVGDINDNSCIDFIKENKPDLIFVYGTSILNKEFLSNIKVPILNIHSGILPKYRNVHSEFWAYFNKDYNNIGVSIIYLDKFIDSGDVVLQKRIKYMKGDNLIDIKIKILRSIPDLIMETVKSVQGNSLTRKKQDTKKSNFYSTPKFLDIIRLLYS